MRHACPRWSEQEEDFLVIWTALKTKSPANCEAYYPKDCTL
jgi:hypothetical protein